MAAGRLRGPHAEDLILKKRALPFLGARVVVFTVTRSVSEAEEPSRRDFLAHASGYCAPRNGRAKETKGLTPQ